MSISMKLLSKYLVVVFCSLLFVSCSDDGEDTINVTIVDDKSLDNNLIGTWSYPNSSVVSEYVSFSSNGRYSFWQENSSTGITSPRNSGEWWTNDNWLFLLDHNTDQRAEVWNYTITGDSLYMVGSYAISFQR